MEYSEQYIHTRSSSQRGGQSPPIGELYDRVVDGAYWPLNTRFLDARWVGRQHRRQHEPIYDLTTIYSLKPSDLVGPGTGNPAGYSERLQFLYALMEKGLEDVPGVRFRVGVKLARRTVPEQVPPDVMAYVIEQYLPYDEYLDVVFRSRLLYCPKNAWHEPGSDGAGERTYRLFENLALGCVCLSSPVRLHCDFEPGVHYVAIRGDFGDLEDVITHYLSRPDKLAQIRRNVQPLYEQHLSPIAIARHYLATFRKLSLERTT
jgi:hypothetical protein